MDYSYWATSAQPFDDIVAGARWAESDGWRGVWVPDHFMPNVDPEAEGSDAELEPVLEAWTLQAALAALVPRLRIGAMVTGNTYRHPAVLANMATTVDHISGGRAVLGIGAGWQRNEHRHYGIDLGTPRERSDRLEEACEVIVGLLRSPRTDFDGAHYALIDAPAEPKPVSSHLPLLVAGRGPQRTLRTVARYADEWNAWALPEEVPGLRSVIERHAEACDRDPSTIRVTVAAMAHFCTDESKAEELRSLYEHRGGLVGTIDQLCGQVEAYVRAGVDELVVPDFNMPRDRREELLGTLRSDVFDAVA